MPGYEYFKTDEKKRRLLLLSKHIDALVKRTEEYMCDGILATSVAHFLKRCEEVKQRIATYTAPGNIESDENSKEKAAKISNLEKDLKHLESLTKEIKKEGIAKDTLEPFVNECNRFQEEIRGNIEIRDTKPKIDATTQSTVSLLSTYIDEASELTAEAKQKGLKTNSFDNFINLCNDMKNKIENRKKEIQVKPVGFGTPKELKKLGSNIDEVMNLVDNLKKEGLLTESVEALLRTGARTRANINNFNGDDMKTLMTYSKSCACDSEASQSNTYPKCPITQKMENEDKNKTIGAKIKAYLKNGSLKSKSMTSEKRIDMKSMCSCDDKGSTKSGSRITFADEKKCTNDVIKSIMENQERSNGKGTKSFPVGSSKNDGVIENKETKTMLDDNNFPCESCPKGDVEIEVEEESPEPSIKCDICERVEEEEEEEQTEENDEIPKIKQDIQDLEDKLGYFETKVKRIVRLKRTKNDDGTVKEETTTITIRKQKHDPTENEFQDDDEADLNVSNESILIQSNEQKNGNINLCLDAEEGARGFKRNVKKYNSETDATNKTKNNDKKSASESKVGTSKSGNEK